MGIPTGLNLYNLKPCRQGSNIVHTEIIILKQPVRPLEPCVNSFELSEALFSVKPIILDEDFLSI